MARKPILSYKPPLMGETIGFSNGPGGLAVCDDSGPGHWAKITGTASGYKYAHVPVAPVGDGTFVEMTSAELPAGTATSLPAVEASQNESVPTDGTIIVWLQPDPTVPGYRFNFGTGPGKGTILKVLTDWQCVSSVPTLTFKYVWLPPGAQIYTDLASAESAHPGAAEA
jgi:hypothetical protein